MHAVEFEADIQDGVIRIPDQYAHLKNAHARIVVLLEEASEDSSMVGQPAGLDFSQLNVPSLDIREGVEYQRKLRDEW